ncbi:MAG TPA: VOC family protein [Ilumatobacter sp.]|nr:VOC family protein [Ilumatobacter sp.]
MGRHDGVVEQRLSFVTLVVRDLAASRRFYVDGLGWTPAFEAPGNVMMFEVAAKVVLSLWDHAAAEAEIGEVGPVTGSAPIALAHNLATRDEVDAVLATARAAGATAVHDAVDRDWGGYSGYFADPDGFRWEIAWNPGEIGQSVLP